MVTHVKSHDGKYYVKTIKSLDAKGCKKIDFLFKQAALSNQSTECQSVSQSGSVNIKNSSSPDKSVKSSSYTCINMFILSVLNVYI